MRAVLEKYSGVEIWRGVGAIGLHAEITIFHVVAGRFGAEQLKAGVGKIIKCQRPDGAIRAVTMQPADRPGGGRNLRAVQNDDGMIDETGLGGAVNDSAGADERREFTEWRDREHAAGVAGIGDGNLKLDGRAGMVVRVINRRAQTAEAAVGRVGDEAAQRRQRRAVKIGNGGAVAEAQGQVADLVIKLGVGRQRIKRVAETVGEGAGSVVHHGNQIIRAGRNGIAVNDECAFAVRAAQDIGIIHRDVTIAVMPLMFVLQAEEMPTFMAHQSACETMQHHDGIGGG